MKKRNLFLRFYLPIIILFAAIFFGLGFVVSQGTGMPSSGNVPNPGHASERILCNGCVGNANLGTDAVTSTKIAPSTIAAVDVNTNEICTLNSGVYSLACPSANPGGSIQCITVSASGNIASCAVGTLTGGGCSCSGPSPMFASAIERSRPSGTLNAWSCSCSDSRTPVSTYAICCSLI